MRLRLPLAVAALLHSAAAQPASAPVCCDVDGACDDGSDDWCCGETYDCCCLSVAL
eukprot:COSAG03_NODE_9796_length_692_cov_16.880270_1_plen_55_part_01